MIKKLLLSLLACCLLCSQASALKVSGCSGAKFYCVVAYIIEIIDGADEKDVDGRKLMEAVRTRLIRCREMDKVCGYTGSAARRRAIEVKVMFLADEKNSEDLKKILEKARKVDENRKKAKEEKAKKRAEEKAEREAKKRARGEARKNAGSSPTSSQPSKSPTQPTRTSSTRRSPSSVNRGPTRKPSPQASKSTTPQSQSKETEAKRLEDDDTAEIEQRYYALVMQDDCKDDTNTNENEQYYALMRDEDDTDKREQNKARDRYLDEEYADRRRQEQDKQFAENAGAARAREGADRAMERFNNEARGRGQLRIVGLVDGAGNRFEF